MDLSDRERDRPADPDAGFLHARGHAQGPEQRGHLLLATQRNGHDHEDSHHFPQPQPPAGHAQGAG
ncbi:hypothetical protein DSI31_19180, partial [Mycobacterium tuberculosis]